MSRPARSGEETRRGRCKRCLKDPKGGENPMRTLIAGIVFTLIASSSAAQWIQQPTPGIPRTSDGKPDLTAPAPRTRDGKPDLSGVWEREGDDRYYNN